MSENTTNQDNSLIDLHAALGKAALDAARAEHDEGAMLRSLLPDQEDAPAGPEWSEPVRKADAYAFLRESLRGTGQQGLEEHLSLVRRMMVTVRERTRRLSKLYFPDHPEQGSVLTSSGRPEHVIATDRAVEEAKVLSLRAGDAIRVIASVGKAL